MTLPKGYGPGGRKNSNENRNSNKRTKIKWEKLRTAWLGIILLSVYVGILLLAYTFVRPISNVIYVFYLIAFVALIWNLISFRVRGAESYIVEDNPSELRGDSPVIIFSLMYGFVAAFAITEALKTFFDPVTRRISPLDVQTMLFQNPDHLFNLIIFFSVAVPFVNAGIVFLSTKATELIQEKAKTKDASSIFSLFFLSTIQAIFLFFMAETLDNTPIFISFVTVGLGVDIIWAVQAMRINFRKVTKAILNKNFKSRMTRSLLNGFMLMFCWQFSSLLCLKLLLLVCRPLM
jgi:hypothetical protein